MENHSMATTVVVAVVVVLVVDLKKTHLLNRIEEQRADTQIIMSDVF
jgi:hypothetical protein